MVQSAPREPRFTYRDYLQFADGERWELIDGVAHNMSPAPSPRHQAFVGAIYRQLANALEGQVCRVFVAPLDVRLPASPGDPDEAIVDVVQPDVLVVCDPAQIDEKGCLGAPDVVIEVLSPSTAAKDQTKKRDLYARHGVKEYWLVHPTDGVLTIYRAPSAGRFAEQDVVALEGRHAFASLSGVYLDWGFVAPGSPIG